MIRVEENAEHCVKAALTTGVSHASGWGVDERDPSFVVLVLTGETAEKFKPLVAEIASLARKK